MKKSSKKYLKINDEDIRQIYSGDQVRLVGYINKIPLNDNNTQYNIFNLEQYYNDLNDMRDNDDINITLNITNDNNDDDNNIENDIKLLKKEEFQIIIGCPGRINDMINRKILKLENLKRDCFADHANAGTMDVTVGLKGYLPPGSPERSKTLKKTVQTSKKASQTFENSRKRPKRV